MGNEFDLTAVGIFEEFLGYPKNQWWDSAPPGTRGGVGGGGFGDVAVCVESHHWFWGIPRILQKSLPPSNRTRFPRFLDRSYSLPEFSTTRESTLKNSFRNTQVEGILNRLGFHTAWRAWCGCARAPRRSWYTRTCPPVCGPAPIPAQE